jgi:1-aminocyclopropane-1-carboxylate deaminase/D-cysteine desulfhydrase-like pyridoxal-dependent ACC family enzyme
MPKLLQNKLDALKPYEALPVEIREGFYFKRCDFYAPFEKNGVNGCKLFQGASLLVAAARSGSTRALTGCSINSPQAAMIAALCQFLDMDCTIYYGAKPETIFNHKMPQLAKKYGAKFKFCASGRSNVLYYNIKRDKQSTDFILEYGMNASDPKNFVSFFETTANQVKNLPENLDNLFVTCGSGITSTGILYGLKKYKKSVGNVYLFGNGPNRIHKIKKRLIQLEMQTNIRCRNQKFIYIDLFAQGVKYEEHVKCIFHGIKLHPHYEAKAGRWLKENKQLFKNQKNCFWIIGSEPEI